jgi:membrane-associated phospholipid phosphatase
MRRYAAPVLWSRRRRTVLSLALAISAFVPALVAAQQKPIDPRDTTHAQHQAPFFTRKDAFLGVGFVVGTVAMFPLDRQIASNLQNPGTQANRFLKNASTGAEAIASPGAYFIGGTLYVVGRLTHADRVADLGWHGTEAVLVADGVTWIIKGVAGRARPFLSNETDPTDWVATKGFTSGDWSSFPSGHTSTAFAAAAAVTNETTRWWPRSEWIVGPVMYAGATAVGLSRMYHNKHWASDVVLGAAIGTFSGRKVVQYAHGHPHNFIDRWMLRTSVVPDGHGGVLVGYSIDDP